MDVDSAHTGTAVSVDLSVLLSFKFWETYRPNFTQLCLQLKEIGNLIEIQYFDSEKRGNSVILHDFTEVYRISKKMLPVRPGTIQAQNAGPFQEVYHISSISESSNIENTSTNPIYGL